MTYGDTVVIDGEVGLLNTIEGELNLNAEIEGEVGVITKVVEHDLPTYTGQTVITPSDIAQTLATAEKVVASNITINPIPENYGRLTWSGNTLTVY